MNAAGELHITLAVDGLIGTEEEQEDCPCGEGCSICPHCNDHTCLEEDTCDCTGENHEWCSQCEQFICYKGGYCDECDEERCDDCGVCSCTACEKCNGCECEGECNCAYE